MSKGHLDDTPDRVVHNLIEVLGQPGVSIARSHQGTHRRVREHNELPLTGLHETQAIDKLSYAISDRGASIRIPIGTVNNGWKGYLEDRRPASDADPYKVPAQIIRTVKSAALPQLV